jgi:hypothetical protein
MVPIEYIYAGAFLHNAGPHKFNHCTRCRLNRCKYLQEQIPIFAYLRVSASS